MSQAGLDSVGRFVVLVEPRNHGIAKEAATGHGAARAKAQRRRIRIGSSHHAGQRDLRNVRRAGKSKQTRIGIQIVFIRAAGECSGGPAAGRRLTRKTAAWG